MFGKLMTRFIAKMCNEKKLNIKIYSTNFDQCHFTKKLGIIKTTVNGKNNDHYFLYRPSTVLIGE